MNSKARAVARFGLLTALSLVLGLLDRAIPLTWFLSGAVPGIKLGLAWVLHRRLKRFVY